MLGSVTGQRDREVSSGYRQALWSRFPKYNPRHDEALRLFAELGAKEIAAVVGYSYGGYLTSMGVNYPDRMRLLCGRNGDYGRVTALCTNWNSTTCRLEWGLFLYRGRRGRGGVDRLPYKRASQLRGRCGTGDRGLATDAVDAELHAQAAKRATGFDANALNVLRCCATKFDAKPQVANIAACSMFCDDRQSVRPGTWRADYRACTEAGVEASMN